ncbi:MAG: hypothetical protein ABR562_08030, partial [Thermoplasmatota archaeon]
MLKLRLAFIRFRDDPPSTHPLGDYANLLPDEDGVAVYALEDPTGDWPDGLPLTQPFRRGATRNQARL